jgi:hypothetical protein
MVEQRFSKPSNAGSNPVFSAVFIIKIPLKALLIYGVLINVLFNKMRLPISQQIKKDLAVSNRKLRKRLVKVAKLYIAPEQAKIGPALAQIGINSMEFCERFNSQTRTLDKELSLPVRINVFSDKSFSYQIKLLQLKDLVTSFSLDER